jgi:hypothetical protein
VKSLKKTVECGGLLEGCERNPLAIIYENKYLKYDDVLVSIL